MNKIIVESTENDVYEQDQNYMTMRSKLFSEKTLNLIDNKMLAKVLNRFADTVSTQIIHRYDIFKRKAYDADITKKAFDNNNGIQFYEKILNINQSPYIRHQYSLFLQRKNLYELAWKQIDQAYTESKGKIFSIANTHAIIMFEKNIKNTINDEKELSLLKYTIKKSFTTLEYCITKDVRVNYHVLTYSRNAIRYYEKFGSDEYTSMYVDSALNQLNIILKSNEYIFRGTLKELENLQKELIEIQQML